MGAKPIRYWNFKQMLLKGTSKRCHSMEVCGSVPPWMGFYAFCLDSLGLCLDGSTQNYTVTPSSEHGASIKSETLSRSVCSPSAGLLCLSLVREVRNSGNKMHPWRYWRYPSLSHPEFYFKFPPGPQPLINHWDSATWILGREEGGRGRGDIKDPSVSNSGHLAQLGSRDKQAYNSCHHSGIVQAVAISRAPPAGCHSYHGKELFSNTCTCKLWSLCNKMAFCHTITAWHKSPVHRHFGEKNDIFWL